MNKILVVGSINVDLVMSVTSIPEIGETLQCEKFDYMYGGKGANQAVAARRMGSEVYMLGCVGDDTFGLKAITNMKKEQVNTDHMHVIQGVFTGLATVMKTASDNAIVISEGANGCCTKEMIQMSSDIMKSVDVVIIQNEISVETLLFTLKEAKRLKKITVYNPAPYRDIPDEYYAYIDYITPNETEFKRMIGTSLQDDEELQEQMLGFTKKYGTTLIVTRGKQGVSYVQDGLVHTIDAVDAEVVDTTGAGDTFNGALASLLASGENLHNAIKDANYAAALSISQLGAQTGMPTKQEVQEKKKGLPS